MLTWRGHRFLFSFLLATVACSSLCALFSYFPLFRFGMVCVAASSTCVCSVWGARFGGTDVAMLTCRPRSPLGAVILSDSSAVILPDSGAYCPRHPISKI